MPADAWDPGVYERFRSERSRPFFDLLALVRRQKDMRVVDLGCGTGELTRELHHRLRAKATLGVDASPSMLSRAAAQSSPGLQFLRADIAGFAEPGWDLVFSNAALHWVADHGPLIGRLASLLAPRGQLAVQVPANNAHPTHVVAAELAVEPAFAAAMGSFVRRSPVLEGETYAELLHKLGFTEQRVRQEVYLHPLAGPEEAVEWARGSILTPYRERLTPELFETFVARYRARLLRRLGEARPYLLTYRRLLLWASR